MNLLKTRSGVMGYDLHAYVGIDMLYLLEFYLFDAKCRLLNETPIHVLNVCFFYCMVARSWKVVFIRW